MTAPLTPFIALVRAVNVGGAGRLPMALLEDICRSEGFLAVQTYIASGNVVFLSDAPEQTVRSRLEDRLRPTLGPSAGVVVRSARDIRAVIARNPFAEAAPNRVVALFSDDAVPGDPSVLASGVADEELAAGEREIFIHYPNGMAQTRLRHPFQARGTARNMNTLRKLNVLADALVAEA